MRTAVVAIFALAALASAAIPGSAQQADGRPQDLQLEPRVDGSTLVAWTAPLVGDPLQYHVYRSRGPALQDSDWLFVGSTTDHAIVDPEHFVEDDAIQGYRVVAEHAWGAEHADIYGLVRLPPEAALAAADQNIVRIQASGYHACNAVSIGGIPPDWVRIEGPCVAEMAASFLPSPADDLVLCGFYTLWNIVSPALTGVGSGSGSQTTQGGEGCVDK